MTLLKMIKAETEAELETQTNDFVKGGTVHVVVNMRIYQTKEGWVNCLIYKEKYTDEKQPA